MGGHADEILLLKYHQGDAEALAILYQQYKRDFYTFLVRRLNNEAVANDIYQDIWEKVISLRQELADKVLQDSSFRFKKYLYAMARNRIIDHFRSATMQRDVPLELSKVSCDDGRSTQESLVAGPDCEPDQVIQAQDLLECFGQTLNSLPDEQREAFLLRRANFGLDEIAEIQEVKRETVRSRLRYAMQRLNRIQNA